MNICGWWALKIVQAMKRMWVIVTQSGTGSSRGAVLLRQQAGKMFPHPVEEDLVESLLEGLAGQGPVDPRGQNFGQINFQEAGTDFLGDGVDLSLHLAGDLISDIEDVTDLVEFGLDQFPAEVCGTDFIPEGPEGEFFLHGRHFVFENQEIDRVDDEDARGGLPSEGDHHEGGVPVPGARHHQDGRGGEMGQCPADRDVDEQEPQGRVLEAFAGLEFIEFPGQQEG
jgi:hypothetical protein